MNSIDPSRALKVPSWLASFGTVWASLILALSLLRLLRRPRNRTFRLAVGFLLAFGLAAPVGIWFSRLQWSERDRASLEELTNNPHTAVTFDGITTHRLAPGADAATPFISRLRRFHFEVDWMAVLSTAGLAAILAGVVRRRAA